MSESIISIVLPSLLTKTSLSGNGQPSGDIRFLSLKIFTDLVIQYLNDDTVYDPLKDVADCNQADPVSVQTRLLSDLLQTQLFPRIQALFQDSEPMPLYALKLLSAVIEKNPPLFAR